MDGQEASQLLALADNPNVKLVFYSRVLYLLFSQQVTATRFSRGTMRVLCRRQFAARLLRNFLNGWWDGHAGSAEDGGTRALDLAA